MNITIAKQYLYEMNYSKSVEYYSKAFSGNNNLGRVEDRYNAAKCWAVLGNLDSAFYQLDKCVKGKFKEYFSILSAPEFDLIKKDPKWSILLQLIKENKIEIELKRNSNVDSLNLNLAFTLDSMHYVDQSNRTKLAELESRYGGSSTQAKNQKNVLISGDSINELIIIEILDKNGWLGPNTIGKKANEAIFLIVQHASIVTQEKYLPLLRHAVKDGSASASELALLEDRIAIRHGKPQVYGSQLRLSKKDSFYYVLPMIEPEMVNSRRKLVGLQPIEEYLKHWRIQWSIENYKNSLRKNGHIK